MTVAKRRRAKRSKVTGAKKPTHLTVGAIGGPPAHKQAVKAAQKTAEIAARRKVAWDLFVAGATIAQVAKQTKVSDFTAHGDVVAYRNFLRDHGGMDAETLRFRQQELVDTIKRAHYGSRAKPINARVLLDALAHESRLWGLDVKKIDGYTPDQLMAVVGGLVRLFQELVPAGGTVDAAEIRARYGAGVQRLIGDLSAGVRDVTPKKVEET